MAARARTVWQRLETILDLAHDMLSRAAELCPSISTADQASKKNLARIVKYTVDARKQIKTALDLEPANEEPKEKDKKN